MRVLQEDIMRTSHRTSALAGAVVATLLLAACSGESPSDDGDGSGEGGPTPFITLEAITVEPMDPGAPSDDPYCQVAMEALIEWSGLASRIDSEVLPSVATAVFSGDTTGLNALGGELSDSMVAERELMYDALEFVDEPEPRDTIGGMIAYLDSVVGPVALMLVATNDVNQLSLDMGDFLSRADVQALVDGQTAVAADFEEYTEVRCGVDINTFTS
jgi:hypothetical protein